jgi:tetratricopeptide (TPR) repeat protein
MSRLDEYFKKKTKELSFIELKEGSSVDVNGYRIDSETPLPILTESLIEEVRTGNPEEEVRFSNMINGMIYTIGIDPEFKHIEEYKEALYSYDSNIEAYIKYLGVESLKNNKVDDAMICFRAVLELNEKNKEARYSYAVAMEERAKRAYELDDKKLGAAFLKEALRQMEKIESNEMPITHYKLGYYYKHFSEFRKSKIVWEKFLRAGEEKELLEEIREQLESIEDDVTYEEGYTSILEGRASEGIAKLLPLTEKYKSWWNLSFMLGLGYRQIGEVDEAMAYFKEALEVNPGQIDSLNELGLCYAAKLEFEKSIEMFSEAIKIEPKNHEIICNRGMAKFQLGQIEEAKADIERAYKINPEDEVVLACRRALEETE